MAVVLTQQWHRLPVAATSVAAVVLLTFGTGISDHLLGSGVHATDSLSNPRQAIFDELTPEETRAVAKYVVDAMNTKEIHMKTTYYPDIPLTALGAAAMGNLDPMYDAMLPHGHNYIVGTTAVTLLPPAKDAALAYVDGTSDERPAPRAHTS